MSLESLMTRKIDLVRAEIENIHYQHVTPGTYHGRWDDDEARREYTILLESLPEIPGLSLEEIEILKKEIQYKIDKIGVYVDPDYNVETIKNSNDFRKAIERVHHQHRYDAGAMFGTLTADEAERDYNTLMQLIDEVEGLTEEEKVEFRTEIATRIENIPKVQQEKRAERIAYDQAFDKAFAEAKKRFDKLSFFEKMKLRRARKAPEHQKTDFMTIEDVNRLYR